MKRKMRLRMEWWKYVLLGVSLMPLVYACYLFWQAHNNRIHVLMSAKEYQQMRCASWLKDEDTAADDRESLIREYYHCFFSLRDNTPCYKRFHEEAVSCLEQGHKTMSEEQIKQHITGGIMEEKCQDSKKTCAFPQSEGNTAADNEKLNKALQAWCQDRLLQECSDLGYPVK